MTHRRRRTSSAPLTTCRTGAAQSERAHGGHRSAVSAFLSPDTPGSTATTVGWVPAHGEKLHRRTADCTPRRRGRCGRHRGRARGSRGGWSGNSWRCRNWTSCPPVPPPRMLAGKSASGRPPPQDGSRSLRLARLTCVPDGEEQPGPGRSRRPASGTGTSTMRTAVAARSTRRRAACRAWNDKLGQRDRSNALPGVIAISAWDRRPAVTRECRRAL